MECITAESIVESIKNNTCINCRNEYILSQVAFIWGTQKRDHKELQVLKYNYKPAYNKGLIYVDAADLIPQGIAKEDCIAMGACFAEKCMERFGYKYDHLLYYLVGASHTGNYDTVKLLKQKNPEAYELAYNKLVTQRVFKL